MVRRLGIWISRPLLLQKHTRNIRNKRNDFSIAFLGSIAVDMTCSKCLCNTKIRLAPMRLPMHRNPLWNRLSASYTERCSLAFGDLVG